MPSTDADSRPKALDLAVVQKARKLIEEWDERTLELQVELTEIPAPPFGEEARAARMAEHFRDLGLQDVRIDEAGNVIADLPDGAASPSSDGDPPSWMLVAAHLDTIFPEGTDVRVQREGDRFEGPGISDDGRGLAALLTLARLLVTLDVRLTRRLRFVATVGEEGAGNLRGVRHLFSEGSTFTEGGRGSSGGRSAEERTGLYSRNPPEEEEDRAGEGNSAEGPVEGFISLDGAGLGRIVTRGLGVRRLRLTVSGPGGHSWVNRHAPNPIEALARAVSAMSDFDLPGNPPVGLTVSRWGGGTSINAVPRDAWVELDLRSESGNYLRDLEERVRRLAGGAVAAANAAARAHDRDGGEGLTLEVEVIGDRPAGATDPDSALVQAAVEATRALNAEPEFVASSTDSNIPMSRGIPAITMGAGGEAGSAHTPDEWFRNRNGPEGIFRAFLTVLLSTGIR